MSGEVAEQSPFGLGQVEGVAAAAYQRGVVVDHQVSQRRSNCHPAELRRSTAWIRATSSAMAKGLIR